MWMIYHYVLHSRFCGDIECHFDIRQLHQHRAFNRPNKATKYMVTH